jgi:hypothetical protein
VSVNLRHELDEDAEFPVFTHLNVDVLVHGKKAGEISGTVVERERIPDRYFLSAMDDHSADMQYVGVSLFEPRMGRTKIPALLEGGDASEFDFALHFQVPYRATIQAEWIVGCWRICLTSKDGPLRTVAGQFLPASPF